MPLPTPIGSDSSNATSIGPAVGGGNMVTELATTVIGAPDGGCVKNGAVMLSSAPTPAVPAVVAAVACRIKLKRLPAGSGADGVICTTLSVTIAIAMFDIGLPSASRNCARKELELTA